MKTKIEIIQSLLDKRKITAEEAMTLMEKEKEIVYVPSNVPWTTWPQYPIYDSFTTGDIVVKSEILYN